MYGKLKHYKTLSVFENICDISIKTFVGYCRLLLRGKRNTSMFSKNLLEMRDSIESV